MLGVPGSEHVGKSRTERPDRTRGVQAGFLGVQEQPRETHFRKLQCAVPGGVFQYPEPRELCLAYRQLHGVRSAGKSHLQCGADHLYPDHLSSDSVCPKVHLVASEWFDSLCESRTILTLRRPEVANPSRFGTAEIIITRSPGNCYSTADVTRDHAFQQSLGPAWIRSLAVSGVSVPLR